MFAMGRSLRIGISLVLGIWGLELLKDENF
jgi:hypothetical protein